MKNKNQTKPTKTPAGITVRSIEVTVSGYDAKRLMREHSRNIKRIQDIQKDVTKNYDNISHPVPLFQQI